MQVKAAVTIEGLKETHGSRADEVYNRIANIGGFGIAGNGFHGGQPALDINGCATDALAEIESVLADVEKPDEIADSGEQKKKEGKK